MGILCGISPLPFRGIGDLSHQNMGLSQFYGVKKALVADLIQLKTAKHNSYKK